MNTRPSLKAILFATLLISPGALWAQAGAWKEKTIERWDERLEDSKSVNVRIWDSFPHLNLDFAWDGDVNARNECHGEGELVWRKASADVYSEGETLSTYHGQMADGKKNGQGRLRLKSGATYEGSWKENMRHGEGEYFYANGAYYKGSFANDKMNGKGVMSSPDGESYEGDFLDDLMHGQGVITLPNGATYTSTWDKGQELPESLAQRNSLGDGNPLSIGLTINQARTDTLRKNNAEEGGFDATTYRSHFEKGTIIIEPDFPIWNDWMDGKAHLNPFFEMGIAPAFADAVFYNKSNQNVSITGGYLDIAASSVDTQPLIHIETYSSEMMEMSVVNIGWGDATDCTLKFNFIKASDEITETDSYEFSRSLGSLEDEILVNFTSELTKCGVDVATLKAGGNVTAKNAREVMGRFANIDSQGEWLNSDALLVGELSFKWTDADGQPRTSSLPIQAVIWIDPRVEKGAAGPADGEYKIVLDVSRKNYRIPFDIQKDVAPNSTVRIALDVTAKKSSIHKFRVVLRTSDGQTIQSPPAHLRYFLPRNSHYFDKTQN